MKLMCFIHVYLLFAIEKPKLFTALILLPFQDDGALKEPLVLYKKAY